MIIAVRKPKARSDYECYDVDIEDAAILHIPSQTSSSGIEITTTKHGIFWRFDCYWDRSPYGWERIGHG